MRVIQQDIISAIREKRNFKSGYIKARNSMCCDYPEGRRDQVTWYNDSFEVLLWNNRIAQAETKSKQLVVSSCGYSTPTTTSRLNAVFAALNIPLSAVIRNYSLMFIKAGGEEIKSGTKTEAGGWTVTIA